MIYLSPSTQTENKYNNGKDNECDVCYDIAERVFSILKENNIPVTLGAKHATMAERCRESDKVKANYHVCIHTNAGGGEGTRLFYWPSNKNDALLRRCLDEVGKVSKGSYDVMVANQTFYEVKMPQAVTCYLELEFHDKYGQFIVDHKQEFAEAIARGLGASVNDKKEEPVRDGKLYAVQVGAFGTRDAAIKYAYELKQKYSLSSIIKEV